MKGWAERAGLISLLRAAASGRADLSVRALGDRRVRWAIATGLGPLLRRATARDPDAAASSLWPLVLGADLTARLLSAQHLDALTEIIDACSARVPPLVLLKGISTCEQYYPEPHLRPMRDIDILVDDDAVSIVESILSKLGYQEHAVKPIADWEGHHHGPPRTHPDTGVIVEVHRALFPPRSPLSAHRFFRSEYVMTQLQTTTFRGRAVSRLSDELQIVYTACHWARTPRRHGGVLPMMDITYLLRTTPAIRWSQVLECTAGSSASRYVSLLLTYLSHRGLIDIPREICQRLVWSGPFGRIALRFVHFLIERYLVEGRDFGLIVNRRTFVRMWKLLVLQEPWPWRRRLQGSTT
jgi:hypothetical protein